MEEEDELNQTTTASKSPDRLSNRLYSLISALSDLITASSDLITEHLDLIRLEVKEDIQGVINRIVLVGAMLLMIFFGYCLLLVAVVLLIGWKWGLPGMASATLLLALVHLGVTIPQVKKLVAHFKPGEFTRSRIELENTKTWMNNQIESSSSKELSQNNELLKTPSHKN